MESEPIIEVHTGVVPETFTPLPTNQPHVETQGPKPTSEIDPPTPTVTAAPTVTEAIPFEGLAYFHSLSMSAEAQGYFADLVQDATKFRKLMSNPVTSKIVDTALKIL